MRSTIVLSKGVLSVSLILTLLLPFSIVHAGPAPDDETLSMTPPPIEAEFPTQLPLPVEPTEPVDTEINLDTASSIYYYATMMELGLIESQGEFTEQPLLEFNEEFPTASSVIGSANATNDSKQDAESTIISIDIGGTVYTSTAYIRFLPDQNNNPNRIPRVHFSTTTDFGTFNKGQLSLLGGYNWSADPFLAENPYTSGIAPKRVYLTGLLLDGSAKTKSAIVVWRSDNGGISWSAPTLVAQGSPLSSLNVDKPHIAVSWHSGSIGYVYVAYVRLSVSGNKLYVAKSTNGGLTFGPSVLVATGEINGPQVVISLWSGYVYLIWTDFGANAVKMSRSTDYGQTWSSPEIAATGNMLTGEIKGGVRAGSLPMARFNWVANKISVVWHECATACSSTSSNTDIYYTAKSPSGWQTKVRINDVQANDQFMPALDFDTTGNMIVTFYDRRDDSANIKYHLYMTHINSSGNLLEPNVRVSDFQTDPTKYDGSDYYFKRFIGDYQDIWSQDFWGTEYYLPSWVGINWNGTKWVGDIYISAIQP